MTTPTARYVDAFERSSRDLPGAKLAWLAKLRAEGIARFRELGFPRRDDEEWRGTSSAPLAKHPFAPAEAHAPRVTRELIAPLRLPGEAHAELVFVDGRFAPDLSTWPAKAHDVHVGSLADALASRAAAVEPHLARIATDARAPFLALNTAFFTDGAFVDIARGVVLEKPIHLLFLATSASEHALISPRNLLVVGGGARASVVETYAAIPPSRTEPEARPNVQERQRRESERGDAQREARSGSANGAYWTNAATEVTIGEGAHLEHAKVQRESESAFHTATFHATQARASNLVSHSASFGGALVRNDLTDVFNGEGSTSELWGLFALRGAQVVDNHTRIDHAKPRCSSREVYKGVLDGRSRGVFFGRIYVRPDAQKTDAKQTNKNLLLSDEALVDSTPQLEIYADDVKCTHGSTTGQLEDEQVFYLRARGIDEPTARSMLTFAFARDVLSHVTHAPLRQQLEALFLERLPNGAGLSEEI
ncbi:MAG: Fe-S cluster assembly protein SufD [Thermoplasmatota archaeon]